MNIKLDSREDEYNSVETFFFTVETISIPSLYFVAQKKHSYVEEIMSTTLMNITFGQSNVEHKLVERNDLIYRLVNVTLTDKKTVYLVST